MDYQALKTELLAGHPDTGAYDGNDQTAADQLNAVNRTVNRQVLTGDELFNATDTAEFAALPEHRQALWVSFCSKDVDPFAAANVAFVQWVFGTSATTVAALATIREQPTSRANELGFGRIIIGDVQNARAI